MKKILGLLVIGVLVYVAVTTAATSKNNFTVKVTPVKPTPGGLVMVIGAFDNSDGTSTLILDACGTLLEISAPTKEVSPENEALEKFIMDEVDKACGE